MPASTRRPVPYTEDGLRRVVCSIPGCTARARHQWHVRSCAAGSPATWRAVCDEHDIALNRYLLETFGFAGVDGVIDQYRRTLSCPN